jgi:hypothetical protein
VHQIWNVCCAFVPFHSFIHSFIHSVTQAKKTPADLQAFFQTVGLAFLFKNGLQMEAVKCDGRRNDVCACVRVCVYIYILNVYSQTIGVCSETHIKHINALTN